MTYQVTISKEQMDKFRDQAHKELESRLIVIISTGDPYEEIMEAFVNGCVFGFIEAQNSVGDAILKDLNL